MTVLLLTWSGDASSVSKVQSLVEQGGTPCFRLDSDQYPSAVEIDLQDDNGTGHFEIRSNQGRVRSDEITAVWYRRCRPALESPEDTEQALVDASREEARSVLKGLVATVPGFHLDPEPRVVRAAHKPVQLQVARSLGMEIPRTLVSNSPQSVKKFVRSIRTGVVTKMQTAVRLANEGSVRCVLTNQLHPEDLEDLNGLRWCPMVFQEMLPKKVELRVTVVGNQIFTAAIDSQSVETAEVDWRRDGVDLADHWTPYELPSLVANQCLQLVQHFGLNYGAIDFVVTPDDRHVFLEINPQGEFAWLEENSPGLPISVAIANLLRRGARGTKERPEVARSSGS